MVKAIHLCGSGNIFAPRNQIKSTSKIHPIFRKSNGSRPDSPN
jgi:hypothetical protein